MAVSRSGLVSALAPLISGVGLNNDAPSYIVQLVIGCTDTMERVVESQDATATALIDRGILTALASRIGHEVNLAQGGGDRSSMAPSRRQLLKGLLRVVCRALHCPDVGQHVRVLCGGDLPKHLAAIIAQPKVFGGSAFAGAPSNNRVGVLYWVGWSMRRFTQCSMYSNAVFYYWSVGCTVVRYTRKLSILADVLQS